MRGDIISEYAKTREEEIFEFILNGLIALAPKEQDLIYEIVKTKDVTLTKKISQNAFWVAIENLVKNDFFTEDELEYQIIIREILFNVKGEDEVLNEVELGICDEIYFTNPIKKANKYYKELSKFRINTSTREKNAYELYVKALEIDAKYYEEIYDNHDKELGKELVKKREIMWLLLLMSRDEKLVKKHDILTQLEKLIDEELEGNFPLSNKNEEIFYDYLETSFDSDNDNAHDDIMFGIYSTSNLIGILFLSLLGKTEKIDKILFINIYKRFAITTSSSDCKRMFEQVLKSDKTDITVDKLIAIALKNKALAVPLITMIPEEYYPEFKKVNAVNIEEIYKMILLIPTLKVTKDFIYEKNNILDYKGIDDHKYFALLLMNIVEVVENYFENTELTKRLNLITKMCYDTTLNDIENFNKYEITTNAYAKIFNVFFSTKCMHGQDDIKKVNSITSEFYETLSDFFCQDKEFVKGLISKYNELNISGKFLLLSIINKNLDKYQEDVLNFVDNSKMLMSAYVDIYSKNKELETKFIEKIFDKTLKQRKFVFSYILAIKTTKYNEELKQLLSVEKNEKFKTEIEYYISSSSENTNSTNAIKILLKQENLIEFIPETLMKTNRNDTDLLKASLIYFAVNKITDISPECDELLCDFDTENFEKFCIFLLKFYINSGCDIKDKWILYYTSIYGGEATISILLSALNQYVYAGRSKLITEIVQAITVNKSKNALAIVENMSSNFKKKSIKNACNKSLIEYAKKHNITREELSDMLIPSFDFNDKMQLIFDYGERKFYVELQEDLTFEIKDETGKIFKNLPKGSKNDKEKLVTKAKESYKEIKEKIKTTIQLQSKRMEFAMIEKRTWSYENYTKIFIENPIMQGFASRLIWEAHQDKKAVNTFRYMLDGTYNTATQEEFILTKDMQISIAHPIEMDEKLIANWKEQFEDYEIEQIFIQLDRAVIRPETDDLLAGKIALDSTTVYDTRVIGKVVISQGFSYVFDDVNEYQKYFPTNDIYATFHIDRKDEILDEYNNSCTLNHIEFTRKVDGKFKVIPIPEIPLRIYSECKKISDIIAHEIEL